MPSRDYALAMSDSAHSVGVHTSEGLPRAPLHSIEVKVSSMSRLMITSVVSSPSQNQSSCGSVTVNLCFPGSLGWPPSGLSYGHESTGDSSPAEVSLCWNQAFLCARAIKEYHYLCFDPGIASYHRAVLVDEAALQTTASKQTEFVLHHASNADEALTSINFENSVGRAVPFLRQVSEMHIPSRKVWLKGRVNGTKFCSFDVASHIFESSLYLGQILYKPVQRKGSLWGLRHNIIQLFGSWDFA